MATISDFLISVCELVEAQADDIKHSFLKSAKGFLFYFVASILAVVGVIFILLGVFFALKMYLNEISAYFITAGLAFFFSFIAFKVAKWKEGA